MSKREIKEIIGFIIFSIVNIVIACIVTSSLGIYNTVVLKTFSVVYGNITWELIIVIGLTIIEALFYKCTSTFIERNA